MVAVVSGVGLGLQNSSLAALGGQGQLGEAAFGRGGERVYVNAGNGNLVLQRRDEFLAGNGLPIQLVRTYNSQGQGGDAGNWRLGYSRQLFDFNGAPGSAGSQLRRQAEDGSDTLYRYDAARGVYLAQGGVGAEDTVRWDGQGWTWTDGDSQSQERYDSAGRLRQVQSRDGQTVTLDYDGAGRIVSLRSADGETLFIDYDAQGHLSQLRSVYRDGEQNKTLTRTRYGYDEQNRLSSVTTDLSPDDNSIADGQVYTTRYVYDGASQRLASLQQSDGSRLDFSYVQVDGDYRVLSVSDVRGEQTLTTTFDYDAGGQRTVVRDAAGLRTELNYREGRLQGVAAGGIEQRFDYDGQGRVSAVTDGRGQSTHFDYDAAGNRVAERDAQGQQTRRRYNAQNQVLSETVDGAGTRHNVYDASGLRLRFSLSAEGRVEERRYDAQGREVSRLLYQGGVFVGADDATGEAELQAWAAKQDPSRIERTDTGYDLRGLVASTTRYATLDAAGKGVADGRHSSVRYVYDPAGNLLQKLDGVSGAVLADYLYDGLNRVVRSRDGVGVATTTVYQDAQRQTRVSLSNGLSTVSSYDAAGQLLSVVQQDAGGPLGTARSEYNARNQPVRLIDANGAASVLLYDERGRKVGQVDPAGSVTEWRYNGKDQVIASLRYATRIDIARLSGDPAALSLAALRPAANPAEDRVEHRLYNSLGHLVQTIDAEGGVERHQYDAAGRLTSSTRYATRLSAERLAALASQPGELDPSDAALQPAADPAGDRVSRRYYDRDGLLLGSLDGEGYLSETRYDGAGRAIETVRYAQRARAGDSLDALRPSRDDADQRTRSLYDGAGRLVGRIDAEGYLDETVYDAQGRIVQTIRYATRVGGGDTLAALRPAADRNDRQVLRQYDAADRLQSEEHRPSGLIVRYQYDAQGQVIAVTRQAGDDARSQLKRYDSQGRVSQELSGEGAQALAALGADAGAQQLDAVWSRWGTRHYYNAGGQRIASLGPDGQGGAGARTLYYYDAAGRLSHTLNSLGEISEVRYNAFGDIIATQHYATRLDAGTLAALNGGSSSALPGGLQSEADRLETSQYNRLGQRIAAGDRLNAEREQWRYNAFGEAIGHRLRLDAARGSWQTSGYDRRGLLQSQTRDAEGLALRTESQYDAFGRQIESVDANGHRRRIDYDKLGRQIVTQDPQGGRQSHAYDAFGRELRQTDALGRVTTIAYDDASGRMTVTQADGVQTLTQKNGHGDTVQLIDGLGHTTTYQYNRDGQVLSTTTPAGTTRSGYDSAGHRIESIDANGARTVYHYDAAGRVLQSTVDPDGLKLSSRTEYDAEGRVLRQTDPNGRVTESRYDAAGRLQSVIVDPAGLKLTTTYGYDAQGQRIRVTEAAGTAQAKTTEYEYDGAGRRVRETVDPEGLKQSTAYQYDGNGNVVAKTDAMGKTAHYIYDDNDRLRYSLNVQGLMTETVYDAAGQAVQSRRYATPVSVYGLTTVLTMAELAGRLVTHEKDQSTRTVYDAMGRPSLSIDAAGYVTERRYDAAGRVTDTIRYAKSLAQMGLSAERLQDGAGANLLHNSLFEASAPGKVANWGYGAWNADAEVGGNLNADWRVAEGLAGENTVYLHQTGRHPQDAYQELVQSVPVQGGRRYAFSVYTGAHRANTSLHIVWFNAAGQALGATSEQTGAHRNTPVENLPGGSKLAGYKRTVADGIAPEGAVRGVATLRKTNTAVGENDSWLFATRAQFEELALDASGPSDWKPALVADAADQHSRSFYDAAGRPSLSVDAQGYVTERRYDAAGNVTDTIRYAKSLAQMGLSAERLQEGTRANLLHNSLFEASAPGKVANWGYGAWNADAEVGGNLNADWRVAEGLAGENTVYLHQTGRHPQDAYQELVQSVPVQGGRRYAFSVYTGAHRANTSLHIVWFNAAGQALGATSEQTGAHRNTPVENLPGGSKLAGYKRTVADGIAPEGAVRGVATLRKTNTAVGENDSWLFATRAQFEELAPDASGPSDWKPALVADAADQVTRQRYDAAGRLIQETRGDGQLQATTTYQLDAQGNRIAETDANGHTTRRDYDLLGRLIRETDALGGVTVTEYDAFGNAVKITDPRGYSGYNYYDALGRQTLHISPEGDATATEYNALGQTTRITRYATRVDTAALKAGVAPTLIADAQRDAVTRIEHDALGRQNRIFDAEGGVERMAYDSFSNKLKYFSKLGGIYHYVYDAQGRVLKEISPSGIVKRFEYDGFGNRTLQVEAEGKPEQRTTRYQYDGNNRLIRQIGDAVPIYTLDGGEATVSPSQSWRYDAAGRQIEFTDANGKITRSRYDALGRKTAERNGDGVLSEWDYDAAGNVQTQRVYASPVGLPADGGVPAPANADVRETRYVYDGNNRLIETRLPAQTVGQRDAASGQYTVATQDLVSRQRYDANGNLIETTDARGGRSLHYYDRAGHKLLSVDAAGYATAWDYDAGGRAIRETRYASALSGAYDSATPLDTLRQQLQPHADDRVRETDYDRMGRISVERTLKLQVASADGHSQNAVTATTRYQYNALGKVTQKTDAAGQVTDWRYDAQGRETRRQDAAYTDYEGRSVRPTSDSEYNGLDQLSRQIRRGLDDASEADDQIVRYQYGAGGRLLSQSDAMGNAIRYDYDAAGHLTRTQRARRQADGSEVNDVTGYRYDAAGRQTERRDQSTGMRFETRYNAYGEIVGKRTSADGQGAWQEFADYDGAGRVFRRNEGGVTRAYLYDASGNATLQIESDSVDLRQLSRDQILAAINRPDSGLRLTISEYDGRNQRVATYQPKMVNARDQALVQAERWVSAVPQEGSGGVVSAGAAKAPGVAVAKNPLVGGTVGVGVGGNIKISSASFYGVSGGQFVASAAGVSLVLELPSEMAEMGGGKFHIRLRANTSVILPTVTGGWGWTEFIFQFDGEAIFSGKGHVTVNVPMKVGQSKRIENPADGSPQRVTVPVPQYPVGGAAILKGLYGFGEHMPWGDVAFEIYKQTEVGDYLVHSATLDKKVVYVAPEDYRVASWREYFKDMAAVMYGQGVWAANWKGNTVDTQKIHFQAQPTDTSRLLLLTRPANSSESWQFTEVPPLKINGQNVKGQFALDWSGMARKEYEFRYVAVNDQGVVRNVRQGRLNLNDSAPTITQSEAAVDSALMDSNGWIHLSNLGENATAGRIRFRAPGGEWSAAQAVAGTSVTGINGWFQFLPSNYGLAAGQTWEYELERLDANGQSLGAVVGSFRPGEAASVTQPVAWRDQPQVVHIGGNQPAAATRGLIRYRTAGGAWAEAPLSRAANGEWDWDSSALAKGLSVPTVYEFEYQLFDAKGLMLNRAGGQLTLGGGAVSVNAQGLTLPLLVSFNPPQTQAAQLLLSYRSKGSQGGWTQAALSRNAQGQFALNADALAAGDYEYRYQLADAKGALLTGADGSALDVSGYLRRHSGVDTTRLDWVITGTSQSEHNIIRRQQYNAFGEVSSETDGRGNVTTFEYSAFGQLLAKQDPETAITLADGSSIQRAPRTQYRYDALGNLVATVDANGQLNRQSWLAGGERGQGKSGGELHADGGVKQLGYDVFGNLRVSVDEIGRRSDYRYNANNQLIRQDRAARADGRRGVDEYDYDSAGQHITYQYYGNGYLKSLSDHALDSYTLYEYDQDGNKTFEGYTSLNSQSREFYQYADIQYDALGRVTQIQDPKFLITYRYDAVGNRLNVHSVYHDGVNGQQRTQDYWYRYDSMNRFVTTKGSLVNGQIGRGPQGGDGVDILYNAAGERVQATYASNGNVETYSYSADGYLDSIHINGKLASQRDNDLLGRATAYRDYRWNGDGGVSSQTQSRYDADHKLLSQTRDGATTTYTLMADGTVASSVQTDSGTTTSSYYGYEWWDEAKQSTITAQPYNKDAPGWQQGYSHLSYNVNGHLAEARDEVGQRSLRYVNNAQGLVLKREEIAKGSTYKRQDYYFLDGKQIGAVGNDGASRVDYAQALAQSQIGNRKDQYREGQPVNSADFDQNYEPIGPNYPGQTPGFVTVKAGDTLQSLAASLWGDQAMWYLLADANSLSGSESLTAGQVLKVPNKVTNVHNNSGTYRVYNPGEAIGDVTPTLPDPPPPPQQGGGGCGGLGSIFVAIVAVVAVVYTAGLAASALGAVTTSGIAGTSIAAGTAASSLGAGLAGSLALGGSLGGAGFAAAMIGGAVGSLVSQGVAMAMGMQDRFSWSQVGLSALGAGAAAGIGGGYLSESLKNAPIGIRAAAGNALTQGVGIATGLQKSFNWIAVAASGAAAGVSGWMSDSLGWNSSDPVAGVGYGTLRGLVSGGIQSQLTGQRPNWSAIAAESFGSALGDQV
ncbi:LysM peptidoglycan-binding domain-containing protein, partial [Chromobacterium haemolyticum]